MELAPRDSFAKRHLGINGQAQDEMLKTIQVPSLQKLIDETVPSAIRMASELDLPEAISEYEFLQEIKIIANKNIVAHNFIGQGYYGTICPSVIERNIFQNPGWYTQYTPYQAEISQGRLEALLNFQTVISDLTGLPIANASLLDEGTAAAEAMSMFYGQKNKRNKGEPIKKFFVDRHVFDQTKEVLFARALPLDIEVVIGKWASFDFSEEYFGVLLQYPCAEGALPDYSEFSQKCREAGIYVTVASDLMSLVLLTPPGEWGANAVIGNSQRFGVPMGFGGPHAAFFATEESFKRQIPGRIIGVSVDSMGEKALRMALQTREQHIKREKATSNICTAQALLAIMAGMYAVYHGPEGLLRIAMRIHQLTQLLSKNLTALGINTRHQHFFDTLTLSFDEETLSELKKYAEAKNINFYYTKDQLRISIDETADLHDIKLLVEFFRPFGGSNKDPFNTELNESLSIPEKLNRTSAFLTHSIFHTNRTESRLMRYIKSLENKDLSLVHSMIPLGSCTMKLNGATELIPVSWPEFSSLHPFCPSSQYLGYTQIFQELEAYLCEMTGFTACSLQPNSGAQGELSGLLVIRAYHHDRNEDYRDVALIPSSAHGTNPASAVMAGMKVIVVQCDDNGNIDLQDLEVKAIQYKDRLAALMVTYPSTHGVFESSIIKICEIIHENGGMVYMDGANMNAQVGLTNPDLIGADVCHLNLHKTFAIPHGGGGPGMGPICANKKLAPYLPGHIYAECGGEKAIHSVASAPWGSASILLISYAYIRMLGKDGVKKASEISILNANYIKARLESHYVVLYVGEKGHAAHELILDIRPFKSIGVSAEDVAKRLIDYGFHAPTLSFPVVGTIMIEPTESEDKDELDRFCEAMIQIKKEIDEVARGEMDSKSNVLVNAPHTAKMIAIDNWPYTYSREKAAYPLPYLKDQNKFWSSVARVDNAYGDRHLICTCPPIESYEEEITEKA